MNDIDTIRERHIKTDDDTGYAPDYCMMDGTPWPCDTRVVLVDADRLAKALRGQRVWGDDKATLCWCPTRETHEPSCDAAREALRQHEGSESVPIVVGLVGDQMERAT